VRTEPSASRPQQEHAGRLLDSRYRHTVASQSHVFRGSVDPTKILCRIIQLSRQPIVLGAAVVFAPCVVSGRARCTYIGLRHS